MLSVGRHFVRVGERHVHCRIAGAGPPVLLLHQSPQSSASLLPLIEALAPRFTVIAPDTPGFGHSDPFPSAQPTITDFAAHLAGLLDALGIAAAGVYGVHTGASIGLKLALDHPRRVAALVCDGLARFTEAERRPLLGRYLPPFEPAWDGSHLLWLWARIREQTIYFPWYEDRAANRMHYDLASPDYCHRECLELLGAGDGYRLGYRAPMLHDDPEGPAHLAVPAWLLYRREDVLAPHQQRLPPLPPSVCTETIDGGQPALHARVGAIFADALRADAARASAPATAGSGFWQRCIERVHGGEIALRRRDGDRSGVLLLHDIGCAPARLPALARQPAGPTVIAPELPGHGASDALPEAMSDPAALADALVELVGRAGLATVRIEAAGASAGIGLLVAARLGSRCAGVLLDQPLPLTADERAHWCSTLPDPAPHRTGAHLLDAWNYVRLKALWPPWLPPTRATVRRVDAPSPFRVHADVVEVLRLGSAFAPMLSAALAVDLAASAAGLRCPVRVTAADGHELAERARALARA